MSTIGISIAGLVAVFIAWVYSRFISGTLRLLIEKRSAKRALRRLDWEAVDLDGRLAAIRQRRVEEWPVEKVIAQSSLQERKNLASLLDNDPNAQTEGFVNRLRELGSHSVAAAWRVLSGRGWGNRHVAYEEVFRDVSTHIGVKTDFASRYEAEKALVTKTFAVTLKLSAQERDALLLRMQGELASRGLIGEIKGPAGGAVVIAGAQASGFGIYMMATTLVGGISHAVGIAVPFAAYTGLTKLIAVAIGPIGIAAVGALAVHKVAAPNLKKTVPAILFICAIRNRLISERTQTEKELHGAREALESKRRHLTRRNLKLSSLRQAR